MSVIDNLDFGQDSAESEAGTLHYVFWSAPFYKRLRTLKKWLVLGRKGSGKTASCMMLFRQLESDSSSVALLAPRSLSAAKSAVLDKTSLNSDEAALLKWKYVFLLESGRHVVHAAEQKLGSNYMVWPEPVRKVRTFLVEHDTSEANQLDKAMKFVRSVNKLAISIVKLEGSIEIASKDKVDSLGDDLDLTFHLIQEAAQLVMEQPLYILVDKVDELWDSTEIGQDLIVGLLRAAKETNDHLRSVKVVVFLRSDIYSYLRFHDSDKYRSHTELITWDRNNLKRLIALRIQRSTGIKGNADSIWASVFSPQIDGQDSFDYLVDYTLMRPRDLIQLCNRCRDIASNRGRKEITAQDIKDALTEYSKWKLEDLVSEYAFQYPFLERLLLSVFYCHPTPYLERQDFETLFEPHKSDFVAEYGIGHFESIDTLLQVLYLVGFLGVLHNERVLFESLGDRFILPYATNLIIHPAFRSGLNVPEPKTKPTSVVFDQKGQLVSSQINVAGSYVFVGSDTELVNILFLSANPIDTSRLRLDEEVRAIGIALRQSIFRDKFHLRTHWAVRAADLQRYLLGYSPNIVHLSAHGSRSGDIVLEDDRGQGQLVSVYALSQIFSVLSDKVQCVILDACYSEEAAQAIAENIECVIGISRAASDLAATSFVSAFYKAIGNGKDVKTAFDFGNVQVKLEGLVEADAFVLLAERGKPEKIVFVQQ